ncbi:efflux RND transporter periplasmic adaptor subunit [Jannaschia seohaensis]|uniref:HlyD family secretion protein n=1 Tax=Jannaschia seohaensis TaxID=475081 RepID=A0A2Y9B0Y5_9RHOB|nr:HlyD family efflux transporter periplasmic adaptor subunit [Jannaschia seohaensis]PWJ14403.1 HlyD family secretion protein [Jannaschia seohaensis]SSA50121.1 HlyD family secretion protein [Jannaschia seohaensis]
MRFLGRSLTALFLAALTLALFAWAGQIVYTARQAQEEDGRRSPPVRERVLAANVVTAEPQEIVPVLTAFGEVRARRVLELRAPVGGRVVELADGFEEGGRVEAGQVLMRIDPASAESALAVARADLAGAEAEARDAARSLELARAELAGAEAQRDLQARALQRQVDLSARGVGAAATREQAELALASAEQTILTRRGAVASAETRVDSAALAIDRARIALAEAERDVADRVLEAEFAGTLSEVSIQAGGLVSANEQVASLIDPTDLEVSFRLSAAEHARLLDRDGALVGAPVAAVLDVLGLDLEATGRITREAPAVGEGQTGRVVFAKLEGARGFRPGDFVRVAVEEPALARAIRLPATALSAQGHVLALGEDDRLEEVEVTLLRRQGDDVIVRGPLAGRDVVATRTPVLGEGIKVRPLRPGSAEETPAGPEMVALDPERRARIVAYIEGNTRMPGDVKQRLLTQLEADEVPAAVVTRIEGRMGG